jgi:hypothetical protein
MQTKKKTAARINVVLTMVKAGTRIRKDDTIKTMIKIIKRNGTRIEEYQTRHLAQNMARTTPQVIVSTIPSRRGQQGTTTKMEKKGVSMARETTMGPKGIIITKELVSNILDR